MAKETKKNTQRLTLEVENFGPISKAKVDFRPLTIFVGKSNTGKTYLAKLVYALRGAISTPYPIRRTYLSTYRYHVMRKIESALNRETLKQLHESMKKNETKKFKEQMHRLFNLSCQGLEKDKDFLNGRLNNRIIGCFGVEDVRRLITQSSKSSSIKMENTEPRSKGGNYKFSMSLNLSKSRKLPSCKKRFNITDTILDGSYEWIKKRVDRRKVRQRDTEIGYRFYSYLEELVSILINNCMGQLQNPLFSLPSGRGGIIESHRAVVSSVLRSASKAGIRSQSPIPSLPLMITDFLEMLIESENDPRISRSIKGSNKEKLLKILESEALHGKIEAKRNIAGYPDFYYKAKGFAKSISLIRTSSMISELAPIHILLSQTRFGDEGDVLIFDEPEAHLHPALQKGIARWIAHAVNAGVKCVVTTHSDTFLVQIANLVQMSKMSEKDKKQTAKKYPILEEKDVGVWLFEPNKNNQTEVKEISIDKESGEYSVGYDEVYTSLYNESAGIFDKISKKLKSKANA